MDPIDQIPQAIADEALLASLCHKVAEVDNRDWQAWYAAHQPITGYTRLLRYFLSSLLLDLQKSDIVLDIGAGDLAYSTIVTPLVSGCHTADIGFASHEHEPTFQGDISEIRLPRQSYSKIAIGHTFEHLRESRDTEVLSVVRDALVAGGKCCIEPLFLGQVYVEVFNYETAEHYDSRATKVVTSASNFPGSQTANMGFGRIYDAASLQRRVIQPLKDLDLAYCLYTFTLDGKLLPDMNLYRHKRHSINFPLRMLLINVP